MTATRELQPHERRVGLEFAALEGRVNALAAFLDTETFKSLPGEDRYLMKTQHYHMTEYANALHARLKRIQKREAA